jgi:hypothetical protein
MPENAMKHHEALGFVHPNANRTPPWNKKE